MPLVPLKCEAMAVTCFDFRFQPIFDRWLDETFGYGNFDRVALAGGVKNREGVLAQIDLARTLHSIRRVILINHEDCRAYGEAGSLDQHRRDLHETRAAVLDRHPSVEVELYFARLDGTFERIS